MTFIEAIAAYLCARSTGVSYADGSNRQQTLLPLRLRQNCFVHEGPGDTRSELVVIRADETETLPPDDPRTIQRYQFAIHAKDWFAVNARVAELRSIFPRLGAFTAPSDTAPAYKARIEDNPEPVPQGRDDFERCVSLATITFQYVNL